MEHFDDNEQQAIIDMLTETLKEETFLSCGEKSSWFNDSWQFNWETVRRNLEVPKWTLA